VRETKKRAIPDSPLARARLSKEQALAKLRILQSAQLEGSLLPIDQVRSQWAYAFASLRDRALGMADRIASRGAGRHAAERMKPTQTECCRAKHTRRREIGLKFRLKFLAVYLPCPVATG
jgi:hypothetical protein